MTRSAHYDTIVIGGAVMGSSLAYFLSERARRENVDHSVLVIEADPTYEKASTPLSGGSIRQQFSTPLNVLVSQFGLEVIENWHEWVEVDGQSPELGFVDTGYLFLIDEDRLEGFRQSHAVQRSCGASVELLEIDELAGRFPYLNLDGLVAASLGSREGTFDPWAFMSGFKQRARANGVTYGTDRVIGIGLTQGSISSVSLASGAVLPCSQVVNCAGVRANQVAQMVGLQIPVEARIRTSFVFECRTSIDQIFPLTIDTSGVHVRREGKQFLSGTEPQSDVAVDPEDTRARNEEFEDKIWPALAKRIPQFDEIRVTSSWGGHYAYNTLDHNMVVGSSPINGFFFCNGFSGHGLQQAPAVGRGLSELIFDGSYQTLDLSPLGYERILLGEPVVETNII